MPAGSIFDSEVNNSSNRSKFIIGAIALVVFVSAAAGIYWYTMPVPRSSDAVLAEEIRNTTVLMLAHPTFSGEDFREQILGKGRLVKYVRSLRDAYFLYPTGDDRDFDAFESKYFVDRTKLEFAKEENGEISLGGYSLPISDGMRFFRTTLDNIRIEPNQDLTFQFKD